MTLITIVFFILIIMSQEIKMKEYLITLVDQFGNQEKFIIHEKNALLAVAKASKKFDKAGSELRELVKLEDNLED